MIYSVKYSCNRRRRMDCNEIVCEVVVGRSRFSFVQYCGNASVIYLGFILCVLGYRANLWISPGSLSFFTFSKKNWRLQHTTSTLYLPGLWNYVNQQCWRILVPVLNYKNLFRNIIWIFWWNDSFAANYEKKNFDKMM